MKTLAELQALQPKSLAGIKNLAKQYGKLDKRLSHSEALELAPFSQNAFFQAKDIDTRQGLKLLFDFEKKSFVFYARTIFLWCQ